MYLQKKVARPPPMIVREGEVIAGRFAKLFKDQSRSNFFPAVVAEIDDEGAISSRGQNVQRQTHITSLTWTM